MDEQRNHENNAHPENYEYTQQPFYGQAEPPGKALPASIPPAPSL